MPEPSVWITDGAGKKKPLDEFGIRLAMITMGTEGGTAAFFRIGNGYSAKCPDKTHR